MADQRVERVGQFAGFTFIDPLSVVPVALYFSIFDGVRVLVPVIVRIGFAAMHVRWPQAFVGDPIRGEECYNNDRGAWHECHQRLPRGAKQEEESQKRDEYQSG